MADFNRKFTKTGILDLIVGDSGLPSDNLQLDTPTYRVMSWTIDADNRRLSVTLRITAQQGSLIPEYSRTFSWDVTQLPQSVIDRFKSDYNWITDNIVNILPQFTGSAEV